MDDGLLDSIARRVIKIILTEKTVVHRYCLWTLQFPLFEPPPLSLLCRRRPLWEVSNRETSTTERKEHFVTRKRLVERTRDILVPLKRDPLPPNPKYDAE